MNPRFTILVVCTANVCRSVIAAAILRREAADRGLPLDVRSCGLLFDGEPASGVVVALLGERGIDVSDHRSRKFGPEMIDGVDLVVTMERRHLRELAILLGGPSPRLHTLGALASGLSGGIVGSEVRNDPVARVAAVAAARPPSQLAGNGPDEVDDPHGRSRRVHRKAIEHIEGLCRDLLDGLFPESARR